MFQRTNIFIVLLSVLVFVFHLSMFYFHVFTPRYFGMGLDLSNHSAMIQVRKSLYYLKKIVWIYFFLWRVVTNRLLSCESSLINSGYKVCKIYIHCRILICACILVFLIVEQIVHMTKSNIWIFVLCLVHLFSVYTCLYQDCRGLVLFGLEAL